MKSNICAMLAKRVKEKTKRKQSRCIEKTESSYLSKKLIEMYRKKSIRITIILCQSMRCLKKNKIKLFFIIIRN